MTTDDLKKIGKYEIIELIGRGGMGSVYKAMDTLIKRYVAIKIMTKSQFDEETIRKRFFHEAQAIGQLQHPNIITLFDAGEHEGTPYLVVEYLKGKDLSTVLKEELLPGTYSVLDIPIKICEALEYSHQRGIIHRDIKPANIFLMDSGEVKLMDFGIAKMSDISLTRDGTLLGTVFYISPEQIDGKNVDLRADIYSLGVVIYEIFSGTRPFEGDSFSEVLNNILFSEPRVFTPIDKTFPCALNDVIMKAIEKDRTKRFQTAQEFGVALLRVKEACIQKQKEIESCSFQHAEQLEVQERETESFERDAHPIADGPLTDAIISRTKPGNKKTIWLVFFLAIAGAAVILFVLINSFMNKNELPVGPTAPRVQTDIVPSPGVFFQPWHQGWNEARRKNDLKSYYLFIKEWENEPEVVDLIEQARTSIKALLKVDLEEKIKTLDKDWLNVQSTNTEAAYEMFIDEYKIYDFAADQVHEARKKILLFYKSNTKTYKRKRSLFNLEELFIKIKKDSNQERRLKFRLGCETFLEVYGKDAQAESELARVRGIIDKLDELDL